MAEEKCSTARTGIFDLSEKLERTITAAIKGQAFEVCWKTNQSPETVSQIVLSKNLNDAIVFVAKDQIANDFYSGRNTWSLPSRLGNWRKSM